MGNILYWAYIGIRIPYALLTPSKFLVISYMFDWIFF